MFEDVLVALGGDGDDRPLARLDLLQVVDVLVVDAVLRAEENAGRVFVDQRDDAVLQLRGRMALGVDVGDLLHLQRAFQRDAVLHLAAEKEHRMRVAIFLRDRADVRRSAAAPA